MRTPEDRACAQGWGTGYAIATSLLNPEHQPYLKFEKRLVVLDWLAMVSHHWWLQSKTFFCAVALLDRYISRTPGIKREDIQHVGAIALLVASKISDFDPISLSDLMNLCPLPTTRCPRTGRMVPWHEAHPGGGVEALSTFYIKLEFAFCTKLGWALSPPTVVDWIELLCRQMGSVSDAAADLVQTFHASGVRAGPSQHQAGGLRIQLTRNSLAALLRCSASVHGIGLPDEVRGHPVLPPDAVDLPPGLTNGTWPVTVTIAGNSTEAQGSKRQDSGKLSARASCKLMWDATCLATAVLSHADYARFPPSVLAAAILACVLHQYQEEAQRLATERNESIDDEYNHPVSGTSDVAILARLGCLRPVLWQLLAAYLGVGQEDTASASTASSVSPASTPHRPASFRTGVMLSLSEGVGSASTLITPPSLGSSISGKRTHSAMTQEDYPTNSMAGKHAHSSNDVTPTGASSDGSVWPLLPSAITFVRSFMDGIPLPIRHSEVDNILEAPQFSRVLPFLQGYDEGTKAHVTAVEHRRTHGENVYTYSWAMSAFPELTHAGLVKVLKEGATPSLQSHPSTSEEEMMGYAPARHVSRDAAMLRPHTPGLDGPEGTREDRGHQPKRPRPAPSPAVTFRTEEPVARPASSLTVFVQKKGKLPASSMSERPSGPMPAAAAGAVKAGQKRPLFMEPSTYPSSSQRSSLGDSKGRGSEPGSGTDGRVYASGGAVGPIPAAQPVHASGDGATGMRAVQAPLGQGHISGSSRANKMLAAAISSSNASSSVR